MIFLKNEEQIDGIRRSCHLLADMFKYVIPQVKAGMSTKELDNLCRRFMTSHGGHPAWELEGFPGAACISINNEVIHGVPSSKRIIKDGDIVGLDVGIELDGYISDSTHSILVGNVKPEVRKLDEVTLECLQAAIEACKVGNRIGDIAQAVYNIAHKYGYGIVYDYCGHGVGLEVHEDPSIPNDPAYLTANQRIKPGMVLAIEPMINLGVPEVILDQETGWTVLTADGKCSAHEEHTVAVFEDHTEILTALNY